MHSRRLPPQTLPLLAVAVFALAMLASTNVPSTEYIHRTCRSRLRRARRRICVNRRSFPLRCGIAEIVRDAIFYAGLTTLTRSHPANSVSKLFYADNWEDATNFVPDPYVNIARYMRSGFRPASFIPVGEVRPVFSAITTTTPASLSCAAASRALSTPQLLCHIQVSECSTGSLSEWWPS